MGVEITPGAPAIGGPIIGGTAGSVLFVGTGGLFAQDNTNFFFNDSTNQLKVPNILTGTISGGENTAGTLTLNPDDAGTISASGVRQITLDATFTQNNSGTWTGLSALADITKTYVIDSSSAATTVQAFEFGSQVGGESVVQIQNSGTNPVSAFLFSNRQTFRAVQNGVQNILLTGTILDQPNVDVRSGGDMFVIYYGIQSAPAFTGDNASSGTAGVAHFTSNLPNVTEDWTVIERRGFVMKQATVSGGDVQNEVGLWLEGFVATGTRITLQSFDATAHMRHVGDIMIGADSTPTAKLQIQGDDTSQITVLAKMVAAQTASIQEWQNSSSTVLAKVLAAGTFQSKGLLIDGATSGTLTINAAGTTTSYALTMPSAQGAANSFLKNDGSGNLSWATSLSGIQHDTLSGLTDDDHSQYALLAGRSGGQSLTGGTGASETLTLNSTSHGTKGKILFDANSAYDEANIVLALGTTTTTGATRLHLSETNTGTSGTLGQLQMGMSVQPGATSTATYRGISMLHTIPSSISQTMTSATLTGQQIVAINQGTGGLGQMTGGLYQVFAGPLIGTATGSVATTEMTGLQLQAVANVGSGGSNTRMNGAVFNVAQRGAGAITNLVAASVGISVTDNTGGGTVGTITNAWGLRVNGLTQTSGFFGTDSLTAGTITNAIWVEIGAWTSGASNPTYTNPTVQLKLLSDTGTNCIGIQQQGTTPHNRFNGMCMFGQDAQPVVDAQVTGGLATGRTTVSLTADNQVVTVSNKSYIALSSDNGTAGNRTFVLTQGLIAGHLLTLEWVGTNAGELVDDSAVNGGGNHRLSATWTPTQYDIIELIWNGTDWLERNRSAN